VQLALSNLDSNSNVVDDFVFADCRRNITSGLMQVASFMLTARNTVIVMSWRLLCSCISVAAACIYLYLNKLLCISCIRHSDRVDCFECKISADKSTRQSFLLNKHCTELLMGPLWPIIEGFFLIQKQYVNLVCCSNVVFWKLMPIEFALWRFCRCQLFQMPWHLICSF